jgi:hypothetical protein
MPKFCQKCGAEIKYEDAKFCPECGYNLKVGEEVGEEYPVEREKLEEPRQGPTRKAELGKLDAYELGKKLEDFVSRIFQAKGYTTKSRVRLRGESGALAEIDVIAEKMYRGKKLIIAVECKNYTSPVPVHDVRNFVMKIREIGIPQGLFVTSSTFSDDAEKEATNYGIGLWNLERLKEEMLLLETGRLEVGQSYRFPAAEPLNVDFSTATKLEDIQNHQGRVEVSSAKLIWKPYYVVSYVLDANRRDPTGGYHRVSDSGDCVINAIDCSVATFLHTETGIFSGLRRKTEDEILAGQLERKPVEEYEVKGSDEYDIEKISERIGRSPAKKTALIAIVNKNTKDIGYSVKSKDTIAGYERRKFKFKPNLREIVIKDVRLAFVPKWKITFVSGEHLYSREVLGSSGDVTVDTIAYCPEHAFRELFKIFRKNTIAVCEICGKALCNEHIHQCHRCKKWLGVEHSVKCKDCGRFFCKEHLETTCHICNEPICADCIIRCPICGEITCKKDMVECEKCRKKVCRNCAQPVRKFLRTKFICMKCGAGVGFVG